MTSNEQPVDSHPDGGLGRRRFLRSGSLLGIAGLAGCVGGDVGSGGDATATDPAATPTDRPADGGDGSPGTGAPSTPTATSTPTEPPTPTDTPTETATPTTAPAAFYVDVVDTTAPVTATAVLEVEATVENVGDTAGTASVSLLDFDGTERDTATVELAGGEESTETLTWQTEAGDAGTGEVTVETSNDRATATVTIEESEGLSVVERESIDVADTKGFLLSATVSNDRPDTAEGVVVGEVELEEELFRNYREVSVPATGQVDTRVKVTTDHDGGIVFFSYDLTARPDPPDDLDAPTDADYLVVTETDTESVSGADAIRVVATVENVDDAAHSATLVGKITSDSFDQPYSNSTAASVAGGQQTDIAVEVEYDASGTFLYSHLAWIE